jgi:hypothetical protein
MITYLQTFWKPRRRYYDYDYANFVRSASRRFPAGHRRLNWFAINGRTHTRRIARLFFGRLGVDETLFFRCSRSRAL